PSGSAWNAASAPILPPAPALFSITTDCPHLRDRNSKTTRGIRSAVPPAGKGTMTFTARRGYSCAAGLDASLACNQAAARANARLRSVGWRGVINISSARHGPPSGAAGAAHPCGGLHRGGTTSLMSSPAMSWPAAGSSRSQLPLHAGGRGPDPAGLPHDKDPRAAPRGGDQISTLSACRNVRKLGRRYRQAALPKERSADGLGRRRLRAPFHASEAGRNRVGIIAGGKDEGYAAGR